MIGTLEGATNNASVLTKDTGQQLGSIVVIKKDGNDGGVLPITKNVVTFGRCVNYFDFPSTIFPSFLVLYIETPVAIFSLRFQQ